MPETNPTTEEIWRPIVGYEGWYEVSNLGRVKRVRPGGRSKPGFIMRHHFNHAGYATITLCKNGKRSVKKMHNLVAQAFLGPIPPGHDVDHNDRDRGNPELGNLKFLSIFQNRSKPGEQHPSAKLTEEQVKQIRFLHGKVAHKELAERYGIVDSAVTLIVQRKRWKHI